MFYQGVDIRVGNKIEYKDDVWIVETRMHRTPGKGHAMVQLRIRSLTSGRTDEVRSIPLKKSRKRLSKTKKCSFFIKMNRVIISWIMKLMIKYFV